MYKYLKMEHKSFRETGFQIVSSAFDEALGNLTKKTPWTDSRSYLQGVESLYLPSWPQLDKATQHLGEEMQGAPLCTTYSTTHLTSSQMDGLLFEWADGQGIDLLHPISMDKEWVIAHLIVKYVFG